MNDQVMKLAGTPGKKKLRKREFLMSLCTKKREVLCIAP